MSRLAKAVALLALVTPALARAEFLEIRQTVFGMD